MLICVLCYRARCLCTSQEFCVTVEFDGPCTKRKSIRNNDNNTTIVIITLTARTIVQGTR